MGLTALQSDCQTLQFEPITYNGQRGVFLPENDLAYLITIVENYPFLVELDSIHNAEIAQLRLDLSTAKALADNRMIQLNLLQVEMAEKTNQITLLQNTLTQARKYGRRQAWQKRSLYIVSGVLSGLLIWQSTQ